MIDTISHQLGPPAVWMMGSCWGQQRERGQRMSVLNTGPANLSRLIEQQGEGTGVNHQQLQGVFACECSSL